jgi:hypothetical protein
MPDVGRTASWNYDQPPWDGGAQPEPVWEYREPGPGMPGYRPPREPDWPQPQEQTWAEPLEQYLGHPEQYLGQQEQYWGQPTGEYWGQPLEQHWGDDR